ncbi:PQ-loop domain-containing transporter [Legionella drozanskii]|uniref:PQ loop repeat protein n=1 Tax=Legionella drozanskii LLAP-1 TaxID=1212489 RepID=A0A0W0T0W3_9GAMM|nr:PQ-loop domain-containing transporter [Legionella drozanskii]KTC89177.1 hypothetical protein Ldro_0757 [Legionella drozanskii LLAP-1]
MNFLESFVEFGFSISLLVNALLFIPQIFSILRNKTAKGVSLITFAGFNIIQIFTMLHGLYVHDYLLAAGYLLSILTCGTVTALVFYIRYIKNSVKDPVE